MLLHAHTGIGYSDCTVVRVFDFGVATESDAGGQEELFAFYSRFNDDDASLIYPQPKGSE